MTVLKNKKMRFALSLFCILAVVSVILSAAYIDTHAEHIHTGADCHICHMIANAFALLKLVSTIAISLATAAAFSPLYLRFRFSACAPSARVCTPVSQKVKLTA